MVAGTVNASSAYCRGPTAYRLCTLHRNMKISLLCNPPFSLIVLCEGLGREREGNGWHKTKHALLQTGFKKCIFFSFGIEYQPMTQGNLWWYCLVPITSLRDSDGVPRLKETISDHLMQSLSAVSLCSSSLPSQSHKAGMTDAERNLGIKKRKRSPTVTVSNATEAPGLRSVLWSECYYFMPLQSDECLPWNQFSVLTVWCVVQSSCPGLLAETSIIS